MRTLDGVGTSYRPEIDGLRALAVVPVILLHAGLEALSGGFVGVDIFFVISGFLITSIIWREFQTNSFSIAEFYRRRARRILPALLVMLLVVSAFAYLIFLPEQLKGYLMSVLSALFFAANVYFGMTINYFSPDANEIPLLHLWSLGVEEQFYIFFPLVMLIAFRTRKLLLLSLVVIAILSLMLAEYGQRIDPKLNFYLLPTRAWELLTGACIALLIPEFNELRRRLAHWKIEVMSGVGLGLIVFSMFALDKYTPTPSLQLVPTILGAALILVFAGQNTYCGKLLSIYPLRLIGLISYSAYLWHQPIIALLETQTFVELSHKHILVIAVVLTFSAAFISWQFVELPFRFKSTLKKPLVSSLFGLGLASSAVIVLLMYTKVYPENLPAYLRAQQVVDIDVIRFADANESQNSCGNTYLNIRNCPLGVDEGGDIILWGDSYAGAFYQGLSIEAEARGLKGNVYFMPGCPPVVGISNGSSSCNEDVHLHILKTIVEKQSPGVVLLFGNLLGAVRDKGIFIDGEVSSLEMVKRRLEEMKKMLNEAGMQLVIVEQGPRYAEHVSKFYLRNGLLGTGAELSIFRETFENKILELRELKQSSDYYISTLDFFCGTEKCNAKNSDGQPNFIDHDHLTPTAARHLAKYVFEKLKMQPASGSQ